MSTTITERVGAWRQAARKVHAIEVSDRPEAERLDEIRDVLVDLAARPGLFPESAFPRAAGTNGGLFRLAHESDGRGGVYVSLGFTGRGGGNPHTHASWAAVVGVSGGVETNFVYARREDGEFDLTSEVAVGPGDAILLPTGAYHTIEVISDQPVLHVHAYGHPAGFPGFHPPLPVLDPEEARREAAAGRLALITLGQELAGFTGPYVLKAAADGEVEGLGDVPLEIPVALAGAAETAGEFAGPLYGAGRSVVFRLADL